MQAAVSVIIPCYRCVDTIARAVESVIRQTLLPKEILLVEDCSQDEGGTLSSLYDLQQKFQDEITIRVMSLPKNGGPGAARNAGWGEVQQPYLAFLDSDDSWHPRKLEIQYEWMESHPEVAMTGHLSIWVEPGVMPQILPKEFNAHPVGHRSLLISNCFPTRSVMLRSEITNRFDLTKRYSEDYLLWLKIIMDGNSLWLLELPMAYSYKADFGAEGLTGNLWGMECGELDTYRRIYLDGSISRACYSCIVFFSLLKYLRRLFLSMLRDKLK